MAAIATLCAVVTATATEVGIGASKLIVLDKVALSGVAKVVFVSKDGAISKGTGTDVEAIEADFTIRYPFTVPPAFGRFDIPMGSGAGWVSNSAQLAKFTNTLAPAGPAQTKVLLVRPGKRLKLVARGVGEVPFGLMVATGSYTSLCVRNGAEEVCHCSSFVWGDCSVRFLGDGGSYKLKCSPGTADPSCLAFGLP